MEERSELKGNKTVRSEWTLTSRTVNEGTSPRYFIKFRMIGPSPSTWSIFIRRLGAVAPGRGGKTKYGITHSMVHPRRSRLRSTRDTILRTGIKMLDIDGSVNDRCKELMCFI